MNMSSKSLEYSYQDHLKRFDKSMFADNIKKFDDFLISFRDSIQLLYNKQLKIDSSCSSNLHRIVSVFWRFLDDTMTWNHTPFWIMLQTDNIYGISNNINIRVACEEKCYKREFHFSSNIMKFLNFDKEKDPEYWKRLYEKPREGFKILVFHLESIEQLNEFLLEAIETYFLPNEKFE